MLFFRTPGVKLMITKATAKVISIRRETPSVEEAREIADLAYHLWLAGGFTSRSPEEALVAALRQLRAPTQGLFLVATAPLNGPRLNTPSVVSE